MPQQRKPSPFSLLFRFKQNAADLHKSSESSSSPDIRKKNMFDISINLENFLLEEYKPASAFTMQILQDITAALNLYFLLAGIFVSGLGLAYQFGILLQPYLAPALIVFLLIFGVIHFFFFVRFISFGLVYYETSKRMDVMREFYLQQFQPQIPTIEEVLRPHVDSRSFYTSFLPINGILSFLLALIASLCLAGVAFLGSEQLLNSSKGVLFPLPTDIRPYSIGVIMGIAIFIFQILYYRFLQNTSRKLKTK
jgi:hypothetical protein